MSFLYDLLAEREEALRAAHLGKEAGIVNWVASGLWNVGKKVVQNPLKTLGAVATAQGVAAGAKATSSIASNIAPGVAAAPRNVGPTF